jgi:hypothetical protein
MDQVPSPRALRASSVVLLTALLGFLLGAPAADGRNDTASFKYKVTDFSYKGKAQLTGGRVPGCVGTALWEGNVTTAEPDLADLGPIGAASLKIGQHGSSGAIDATVRTTSTLSNAFYRETTACDENGNETAYTMKVCPGTLDSHEQASVKISGGVGDQVKLVWDFTNQNNRGNGHVVPDAFKCGVPYTFPNAVPKACKTVAPLSKFNSDKVKLPFDCFFQTSKPPPGTNATQYEATAQPKGSITLKRTHQS